MSNLRMKSAITSLKEVISAVKVNNLSDARILSCSSKFDYCVRVPNTDLQNMRKVIFSNRGISDTTEFVTEEAVFVLDRVIKLHGKHSFDVELPRKLKFLSDILRSFQRSKSQNSQLLSAAVNDSIFDILPLSKSLQGVYHSTKSLSQEVESSIHDGKMESVMDRVLSFDRELSANGVVLENPSNIPGHELLLSRNGNLSVCLPRRLLRKLVMKCTTDKHDSLPVFRRYLKMISPLDDAVSKTFQKF